MSFLFESIGRLEKVKWIGASLIAIAAAVYGIVSFKQLENNQDNTNKEENNTNIDDNKECKRNNESISVEQGVTSTPTITSPAVAPPTAPPPPIPPTSHVTSSFVSSSYSVDTLYSDNEFSTNDEMEPQSEEDVSAKKELGKAAECLLSIINDSSIETLNWSRDVPCSDWMFTELSDDGETMISLDLITFKQADKFKVDFKDLSDCLSDKLVTLNLEGCAYVSGSIRALEQCPNIENVLLCLTAVVGDISVFETCPKLKHLSLGSRRGRVPIVGDIYVFKSCPELETLRFTTTLTHGNINVFEFTAKLKSVQITKNNIDGDIDVFTKCPLIESIVLSQTKVTGSVHSLIPCSALKKLNLRGCAVIGDLTEITQAMPNCDTLF